MTEAIKDRLPLLSAIGAVLVVFLTLLHQYVDWSIDRKMTQFQMHDLENRAIRVRSFAEETNLRIHDLEQQVKELQRRELAR